MACFSAVGGARQRRRGGGGGGALSSGGKGGASSGGAGDGYAAAHAAAWGIALCFVYFYNRLQLHVQCWNNTVECFNVAAASSPVLR